MHELAVCQALLAQVEQVAREHGASRVTGVVVLIGPLSGVETPLLERAFELARAGGVAASAELHARAAPVRVHCTTCGSESEVAPNRLLCTACGDWRTRVVSGDELLLMRVELDRDPSPASAGDAPRYQATGTVPATERQRV